MREIGKEIAFLTLRLMLPGTAIANAMITMDELRGTYLKVGGVGV